MSEFEYVSIDQAEGAGVPSDILDAVQDIKKYFGQLGAEYPGAICRMLIHLPPPIEISLLASNHGESRIKSDLEEFAQQARLLSALTTKQATD